MLLPLFLLSLLLPTYATSAYAIIDLNALTVSQVVEVEAEEIQAVEEESVEKVEIRHKQKGMLLALWPITFTVRVVVRPEGKVDVFFPWYSAITVDHQGEIETRVRVAVDNALKAKLVGSVKAEGTPTNPKFTPSEALLVEEAVVRSLNLSLTPTGDNAK